MERNKCTLCDLWKTSQIGEGLYSLNCLMGEGDLDSPIMFVDTAPKEEEVKQKKPYVGVEGNFLKKIVKAIGINKVYYTYLLKCKLGFNKNIIKPYIDACSFYLEEEIKKVKPKVIVSLGSHVLHFFGVEDKITKVRGIPVWLKKFNCWLVPTYSPAYLNNFVESSIQQRQFREDLSKALKIFKEGKKVEEKTPVKYKIASTIAEVKKITQELLEAEWFAGDIEFDSLNYFNSKILVNSFSISKNTAFVIPYMHPKGFSEQGQKEVFPYLKQIWESDVKKIFQFCKTDIQVLRSNNIFVKKIAFDTCLAHALLDENSPHNLDTIAPIYTDMGHYKNEVVDYISGKIKILKEGVFQEGKNYYKWVDKKNPKEFQMALDALKKKSVMYKLEGDRIKRKLYLNESLRKSNIYDCPYDKLCWYAAQDADATFRLKEVFWQMLKEQNLLKHLLKIDIPLAYVLAHMEYVGIGVDKEYIENTFKKVEQELINADNAVLNSKEVKAFMQKYQVPGGKFNTASSDQVVKLLYEELKLTPPKYNRLTKTQKEAGKKRGTPSVDAKSLQKLLEKNKIKVLEDLIRISKVAKTVEYFEGYLKLIQNSPDGRIHTVFNQIKSESGGTITGRLSSKNPNLQNVTKRGDKAKLIRRSFISKPGFSFIAADYSQIEFRIWGAASKDPNLIKFVNEGIDIHTRIASVSRKIPEEKVTKEIRTVAKMTVYGLIYGRSTYSIAQEYGMSDFEVKMFVNGFFKLFPQATQYLQRNIELMREQGYITNIFGRRRRVLEIYSKDKVLKEAGERKVRNYPLQSGAADLVFIAMIKLFKAYYDFNNKLGVDMLRTPEKSAVNLELQVHDELISEVKDEYLSEIVNLKKDIMINCVKLPVKLDVDIKVGKDLGNLIEWEEYQKKEN